MVGDTRDAAEWKTLEELRMISRFRRKLILLGPMIAIVLPGGWALLVVRSAVLVEVPGDSVAVKEDMAVLEMLRAVARVGIEEEVDEEEEGVMLEVSSLSLCMNFLLNSTCWLYILRRLDNVSSVASHLLSMLMVFDQAKYNAWGSWLGKLDGMVDNEVFSW